MPERPGEIGIEQHGIASVLSNYWLHVPPNQREYAWTQHEVRRLFQDLKGALSAERYFLGTIVTVPVEGAPGRLEVVDGQQRLATTAILLVAIREYLLERSPKLAKAITDQLSAIDMDELESIPRLRLNVDDNDYFWSAILGLNEEEALPPTLPSHRLLKAAKALAHRHVQNIVSGLHESDHGEALKVWVTFLHHHTTVILLKVPDKRNAFKMFETLNDRGLHSSQADLIKNHLFGRAKDRIAEAQAKWSSMRGSLEALAERDITLTFLRHAATVEYGFVREDDLFERIETEVTAVGSAVQFLSVLDAASSDYVAVLSADSDQWNPYPASTRRSIRALSLLSIKPMRPLMLSVARSFDKREADAAFRAMVSWKVRLRIAGSPRSESVEKPLAEAAHEISEGQIQTAEDLYERLKRIIPRDTQFAEEFAVANVGTAALARYYLRSLEMAAQDDPEPWRIPNDDQEVINLEHVLPKNPMDNWPQFDADEARTYGRRLANQVLLQASSNSILKSAPFEEKKPVLAASPLLLTKQVGDVGNWTRTSIIERGERLAELALKAWPLY